MDHSLTLFHTLRNLKALLSHQHSSSPAAFSWPWVHGVPLLFGFPVPCRLATPRAHPVVVCSRLAESSELVVRGRSAVVQLPALAMLQAVVFRRWGRWGGNTARRLTATPTRFVHVFRRTIRSVVETIVLMFGRLSLPFSCFHRLHAAVRPFHAAVGFARVLSPYGQLRGNPPLPDNFRGFASAASKPPGVTKGAARAVWKREVLCGSEIHKLCCSLMLSFAESTVEEAADWARDVVGISDQAAQRLRDNELDGAAVLEMAKLPQKELREELVAIRLPLGAAIKLAKAISSLGANAQGEWGSGGAVCVALS
jgi:hypothetical protein